jgi:hypothetical protein
VDSNELALAARAGGTSHRRLDPTDAAWDTLPALNSLFLAQDDADKDGMDTHGARALAKRLADEERRRNEAAGETGAIDETVVGGHLDASRNPDPASVVAVERLQGEIASLKEELAARDDAIARLRMELGELRTRTIGAADSSSGEQPPDKSATGHVLFISRPNFYGLLARDGQVPELGAEIILSDWAEGRYRVCKVGPSPLPGDRRRCAFLERLG